MQQRMLLVLLAATLGAACGNARATPPASSSNGNLVELTMRVTEHMAGMPAIPPHTVQRKLCMQAGGFDPEALQDAQQRASQMCTITHYVKQGDTVTFDQMCKVNGEAVASHGVFHLGTDFNFTGTTHTAMNAAGRAITVDGNYVGKHIGSCVYTAPATSSK